MTTTHNVDRVIEDSIREDRIVHVEIREDVNGVDLLNTLAAHADDWVTALDRRHSDDGEELREYWGTDDDGDTWRIHVKIAPGATTTPGDHDHDTE